MPLGPLGAACKRGRIPAYNEKLGEKGVRLRWGFGLLALVLSCTGAAGAEVIVNADVKQESVSRALLRGIFGMRVRVWPDGTPVQVFVLGDSAPEHVKFCKSVLRTYPYQLRQSWDRLVYSGTGQPPTAVASHEEMRELVSATRGAIGYLGEVDEDAAIRVIDVK